MDRITDILVIVNPLVEDQPAVTKAATLARWLGASIEMLVCDTKISRETRAEGGSPAAGNALPSENLESWLEQMAEPLRDDGIDVTTQVIRGDPLHEAVTSWMCNSPADLVVKDTHHHSFAKRTFTILTDWHLIRACPVPLLPMHTKSPMRAFTSMPAWPRSTCRVWPLNGMRTSSSWGPCDVLVVKLPDYAQNLPC